MKRLPKYEYYFRHPQWLNKYVKRYYTIPIVKRLPRWVTPMCLSTLSFLFSTTGIILLLTLPPSLPVNFAVFGCLIVYLCSDHLDGALARYRNQATFVGEFVDHSHDGYGVMFAFSFFISKIGVTTFGPWYLFMTLIATQTMLFFYRQYSSGWLAFKGTTESVISLGFITVLFSVQPIRDFIFSSSFFQTAVLMPGFPFAVATVLILSLVAAIQNRGLHPQMWAYFLSYIPLYILLEPVPFAARVLFFIAYHSLFQSNLIFAKLTKTDIPWPDLYFLLILVGLGFFVTPDLAIWITLVPMFAKFGFSMIKRVIYLGGQNEKEY